MPVSESPWWWSPDETPAGRIVRPIQSDCAPTRSPEIAAERTMPAVCAVAPDSSAARISRRLAVAGSCILGRFERQGDRVDAPPLIGRHVVALALEDVPEMGVAVRAPGLGPDPAQRAVLDQHHRVAFLGLVEARPATVRLELGVRGEQLGAARSAAVDAAGLGVGVLAGEGSLGACLAQDVILLRRQPLAPFVL